MKKTRTKVVQRLQREVAADQIGFNPAVKAVLDTIRAITADPSNKGTLQRLAKINEALPLLEMADPVSGPSRELRFDANSRKWFLTAPLAWRCLETLVDCANTGDLDKFRQCAMCGRWFFARTHDQKCCTSRCRQKLYASTPKGKKERRDYMRGYREKVKKMWLSRDEAYRKALKQIH